MIKMTKKKENFIEENLSKSQNDSQLNLFIVNPIGSWNPS